MHGSKYGDRKNDTMVDAQTIQQAQRNLATFVRKTPVVDVYPIKVSGTSRIWLKLEMLQVSGSFKVRGALNCMLNTPAQNKKAGFVTSSGGNHGAGVAYAARALGELAQVFVPNSTPRSKIERIQSFGAQVEVVGEVWDQTDAYARQVAAQSGARYVHPFGDPHVIAGQGTVGLEIVEQLKQVDLVLAGVGGGGLVTGVALAVHQRYPNARIVGVEPVGAATLQSAMQAGRVVELPGLQTAAGSLAACSTLPLNLKLATRHVEQVVLVSDEQMKQAVAWLHTELALDVELGASAALAALLHNKVDFLGAKSICAIICGRGS